MSDEYIYLVLIDGKPIQWYSGVDDIYHPVLYTLTSALLVMDLLAWGQPNKDGSYVRATQEQLDTGITDLAFYTFTETNAIMRYLDEKRRQSNH
jgi:hypothetical protein